MPFYCHDKDLGLEALIIMIELLFNSPSPPSRELEAAPSHSQAHSTLSSQSLTFKPHDLLRDCLNRLPQLLCQQLHIFLQF